MVVSLIVSHISSSNSHIQNDFYRTVTQTEKQVNYNDKKMQANCTTFTEPLHKHRKTSQLQWQKDAGKLYYLRDDCTKRQQICENLIISYTEQLVYKQAWIHHKVLRQDAMESGRLAHTKEQNASGGKALPVRVKSFSSPL